MLKMEGVGTKSFLSEWGTIGEETLEIPPARDLCRLGPMDKNGWYRPMGGDTAHGDKVKKVPINGKCKRKNYSLDGARKT